MISHKGNPVWSGFWESWISSCTDWVFQHLVGFSAACLLLESNNTLPSLLTSYINCWQDSPTEPHQLWAGLIVHYPSGNLWWYWTCHSAGRYEECSHFIMHLIELKRHVLNKKTSLAFLSSTFSLQIGWGKLRRNSGTTKRIPSAQKQSRCNCYCSLEYIES